MLKQFRQKYFILVLLFWVIAPGCSLFHKSSRQKSEQKMAKAEAKKTGKKKIFS